MRSEIVFHCITVSVEFLLKTLPVYISPVGKVVSHGPKFFSHLMLTFESVDEIQRCYPHSNESSSALHWNLDITNGQGTGNFVRYNSTRFGIYKFSVSLYFTVTGVPQILF